MFLLGAGWGGGGVGGMLICSCSVQGGVVGGWGGGGVGGGGVITFLQSVHLGRRSA